jgi:uncharacterized protein (TIGR03382 family)
MKFYVLNHHPVAWNKDPGSDSGGALKREAAAKIVRSWVADRRAASPSVPVFVTGDFNSRFVIRRGNDDAYRGDRTRLPYCILSSGRVRHVLDVLHGRTGCPMRESTVGGFSIDHIYIAGANAMKVVRAGRIARDGDSPTVTKSSDHAPVYADIKPGIVAAGGDTGTRDAGGIGVDPSIATEPDVVDPADESQPEVPDDLEEPGVAEDGPDAEAPEHADIVAAAGCATGTNAPALFPLASVVAGLWLRRKRARPV